MFDNEARYRSIKPFNVVFQLGIFAIVIEYRKYSTRARIETYIFVEATYIVAKDMRHYFTGNNSHLRTVLRVIKPSLIRGYFPGRNCDLDRGASSCREIRLLAGLRKVANFPRYIESPSQRVSCTRLACVLVDTHGIFARKETWEDKPGNGATGCDRGNRRTHYIAVTG